MSWLTRYYDFPTVLRGDRPALQIALYQDVGMTALVDLSGATSELVVSANPGGAMLKAQSLSVNGTGRLVGIDWADLETIGAGQLNLYYQLKVTFPLGNVRSPLNGRIRIAHATTDARESRIGDRVRVISDVEIAVLEIGIQGPPSVGGPSGEVTWASVTGKPATFPPSVHGHAWDGIADKPTTFPPSAHGHAWDGIADKPTTFPPSAHGHASDFETVASGRRFTASVPDGKAIELNAADVGQGGFKHILRLLDNGIVAFSASTFNNWSVIQAPEAFFFHIGARSENGYPNTPLGIAVDRIYTPRIVFDGWLYEYFTSTSKRAGSGTDTELEITYRRLDARRAITVVSCVGAVLTIRNEAGELVYFSGSHTP